MIDLNSAFTRTKAGTIKRKIVKLLCVMIIFGTLLCLLSCGETNKFSSETEMINAISGTYTLNDNWYIINDNKMFFVDKEILFDTSDEAVDKMINETLSSHKLRNLTLEKLLELKTDCVTEYDLEYDYKNRQIKYGDSNIITVDKTNSLFIDSEKFTVCSGYSDFPSAEMEKSFENYHEVLLDRKEYLSDPINCIPSSEELYNKLKPVLKEYGYDFDQWTTSYKTDNLFQKLGPRDNYSVTFDKRQFHIQASENNFVLVTYSDTGKLELVTISGISLYGITVFDVYKIWDVISSECPENSVISGEYMQNNYADAIDGNLAKWEGNGLTYKLSISGSKHTLIIAPTK